MKVGAIANPAKLAPTRRGLLHAMPSRRQGNDWATWPAHLRFSAWPADPGLHPGL